MQRAYLRFNSVELAANYAIRRTRSPGRLVSHDCEALYDHCDPMHVLRNLIAKNQTGLEFYKTRETTLSLHSPMLTRKAPLPSGITERGKRHLSIATREQHDCELERASACLLSFLLHYFYPSSDVVYRV